METLRVQFENVPGTLGELLTQVKQEDQLRALFRQALVVDALAIVETAVVQMMTDDGSDLSAPDNAAPIAL